MDRHTLSKNQKEEFTWQEKRELKMLREKAKQLSELRKSLKLEYPGETQIDLNVAISMAVKQIAVLEKQKILAKVGQEI